MDEKEVSIQIYSDELKNEYKFWFWDPEIIAEVPLKSCKNPAFVFWDL